MSSPLQIDIQDGIARLTLNRPERHNAFDAATIAALDAAFDAVSADARVRVLVLAANGPSFSAGADLDWMRAAAARPSSENLDDARCLARMLQKLSMLDKPTIARVQGPAYGGGVGLIAACDIAIATRNARFALTEVRLGLIPAAIGPHVIRAIGERYAHRYLLTAEVFTAETAREIGLLHELVANESGLDVVMQDLTLSLMKNGPRALAACKQLIAGVAGQPVSPALVEDTAQRIATIRAGSEAQEGMRAFLERRSPRWCERNSQDIAPCSTKS